jgi:hypothetical protein
MKRLLLLGMVFVLFTGCTTYISLDKDKFTPSYSTDSLSLYKGKDLYLYIYHYSSNSDFAYYYSVNHYRTRYQSMNNYVNRFLDAAYQKAFMHAGFIIYETKPSGRIIPELKFCISELSDEKMVIEPQLLIDEGIRYRKSFTITMPYNKNASREELEQDAFEMVNKAVFTLLSDADFQRTFLSISK